MVAVVGDGALTGGMCYEALNDCGNTKTKLIVVINDNEMSITKNVGALSKYLAKLRVKPGLVLGQAQGAKRAAAHSGGSARRWSGCCTRLKNPYARCSWTRSFFSTLGFAYLGPIDGHDLDAMETVFRRAQKMDMPVAIHLRTIKGYGYQNAEEKPDVFHGTPPFFIENGQTQKNAKEILRQRRGGNADGACQERSPHHGGHRGDDAWHGDRTDFRRSIPNAFSTWASPRNTR